MYFLKSLNYIIKVLINIYTVNILVFSLPDPSFFSFFLLVFHIQPNNNTNSFKFFIFLFFILLFIFLD